jgi:peptidoglycan/LPS O-acetylase OafA/YrhL
MSADRHLFSFDKRRDDNAWLDLLRAVAITLVLLRHGYVSIAQPDAGQGFLEFLALNGWVGVDLFFVLSGYLISGHLIRNGFGTPGFAYRHYISMRALRIVPAYVVVLALILASAFPLYQIGQVDLAWRTAYHLAFLQDYLPADINVAFWSLGVEEKFYLAAPILLWLTLSRKTLAPGLLILAILFALPSAIRAATYLAQAMPIDYVTFFQKLRSPFHASLEPIVIGVAIAVAEKAGAIRLSARQGTCIFVVAGIALVAWLGSHDFMATITLFDAMPQPTLNAILCGFMVLGAVRMTPVAIPFEPVFRVVARLSYALYLVHFPLVPLALAISRSSDSPTAVFWLLLALLRSAA